jgi:hypothetical protein
MGPWVAKLAAESIIEGIKSDPDFRFHSDEEIETLAKKWARAYETKRKRAADFGSQVHNAVEAFYKEW